MSVASVSSRSFWAVTALAALAAVVAILWVQHDNVRSVVSWHGFLHSAIALRFPPLTVPPENPFFAGEPLPYYWAYHLWAGMVARVLDVHPLVVFRGIALASLAGVVAMGGLLGRRRFGATWVGLLAAWLALAGANPLGPLIAGAKHVARDVPLTSSTGASPVETTFVSNDLADEWMAEPLLGAMYVGGDWRVGQNLVWFLDVSSRAAAILLTVVALYLLLGPRGRWGRMVGLTAAAAALTALNVLMGLALAGAMLAAGVGLALTARLRRDEGPGREAWMRLGALVLGAAIALPTYQHLFGGAGAGAQLTDPEALPRRVGMVVTVFLLLGPLALYGAWRDRGEGGMLRILTAAGWGLLAVIAVVHLTEGNEHNVANLAQLVLAVPAAAGVARLAERLRHRRTTLPFVVAFVCVPTAAASLWSFAGRPPLPVAIGQRLDRLPAHGALAELYRWMRDQTPRDAVVIQDPVEPVKMSGNVAELPAFTGRVLFVDHPSYLTLPMPGVASRARLASRMANGASLEREDAERLLALDRPLYLVTYRADDPVLLERLAALHGPAAFHREHVAVFGVAPSTAVRAQREPTAWTVRFATYLGGSAGDQVRDLAVDSAGNVYAAGSTSSPDFPVTGAGPPGALRPGEPATRAIRPMDVFIAKLDPEGRLLWSFRLGGPNLEVAYGIEVDRAGYIYIAGRAGQDFPVTAGSFQPEFQGGQETDFYGPQDGFVCKLAPDAARIVFCSYFGTGDPSIIRDLAVDPNGDIYLASGYRSGSYPPAVAAAFVNRPLGAHDAVVAKVSADGRQVLWARYLGGSGPESNQNSIRVDGSGNPYILFTTESDDVETTPGVHDRAFNGGGDVFVARLTPDTGALEWATYVGGPGNESTETHELGVDSAGNAYVAAPTTAPGFPTTPGAFQRVYGGGGNDVFVTKLDASGRLVSSTLIGGGGYDRPEGVAVDATGRVYFAGTTTSADFPATEGALSRQLSGDRDAIIVQVASDFSGPVWATFLGGSGPEYGRAAVLTASGAFYVAGDTESSDFPVRAAAQPRLGGGNDGFVVRLEPVPRVPSGPGQRRP